MSPWSRSNPTHLEDKDADNLATVSFTIEPVSKGNNSASFHLLSLSLIFPGGFTIHHKKMAEIAVAGAVAVLRQTVSVLGNLAVEEGARLFKLKEEIGWVEREMGYIQTYLRNADSFGEEHENTVEAALVKDIRVLAYDVEDILETYFSLLSTGENENMSVLSKIKNATVGSLKRKRYARNFVKEIEAIKRRVNDIRRVRETYGTMVDNHGSSRIMDIWEERKHFLYANESKIIGFDEHIETLMSRVFDPELQHLPVISIVGMAGLGKTTLAKKVYNSVKPHFDVSAMIYVSQTPNRRQMFLEVAEQVSLEKKKREEENLGLLALNLRTHLEDKRYVLVFDDIWDSQAWDLLKICIPNNCTNGSKIIITSRKTEVASHIGTVRSLYPLKPLNEEVSWNLFLALVVTPLERANVLSDFRELETLGRSIVEKCGGVPLAIEAVAGLLLGKDATENEWKIVLQRMGQDEDKCSQILRLSYKDLPTHLKPCFLYFGIFPEDYEVYASDIINIWIAEGFVRGKRDIEPEDVGRDYLNHLVARNMVQVSKWKFDGRIGACRVHDLWHSFCGMVGTESNFFTEENTLRNNISGTAEVRRVTTSINAMHQDNNLCHEAAKLRAVLYFRRGGSDDDLTYRISNPFKESKCLRVQRIEYDPFPENFANAIDSLTNLKYFRLLGRGQIFSLEIPRTIDNLKGLMTLDLRPMGWVTLPDEIWHIESLRHILLGSYSLTMKKPKLLSRKRGVALPNLQTLHFVPAHALEAEYLRGFTNLRKLGISYPTNSMIKVLSDVKPISDKLVSLKLICYSTIIDLSRYQSLCKFSLRLDNCLLPRSTNMPPNLVKLTLSLSQVEDDPMEILKSLPKLKILKLTLIGYKGKEMVCSGGPEAFPDLEVLEIDTPNSSIKFTVEEHAMPKLKRLKWIKGNTSSMEQFEAPERIKTKFFEEQRISVMRGFIPRRVRKQ